LKLQLNSFYLDAFFGLLDAWYLGRDSFEAGGSAGAEVLLAVSSNGATRGANGSIGARDAGDGI